MKVGDVVEIINKNYIASVPVDIGNKFKIIYLDNSEPAIQIESGNDDWWIYSENIKIIENIETEEFFNFLHSNMEITYRKELFDKLYKQFKQERNEKDAS